MSDVDDARRTKEAVEAALRAGYPPLSDRHGNHIGAVSIAAEALGVHRNTVRDRVKPDALCDREGFPIDWTVYVPRDEDINRIKALRGELGFKPVLPGFEIKTTAERIDGAWVKQERAHGEAFEVPDGHLVKGVSALIDAEGRTVQRWIKTKEGGVDPRAFVEALAEHFADFQPCTTRADAPPLSFTDQLALYPWSDPHFGLYIWGKEASVNWDLRTAVRMIRGTFEKVIARTPTTQQALLLVGGDTLHADSNENRTAASGNPLQVDGRYPKVLLTACETSAHIIDLMLSRHAEVEVIVLQGNHDEHASHAIAFFLHAWYRNEPRVKVDTSPSLFRFREFGKVMIGSTHGHTLKLKDMPAIMATRQPEMWGRTTHRFVHGFHVHHTSKILSEGNGCITETHQIIAPQDAWHFGAGFLSGRSLQSIVYDKVHGEVSRTKVAVTE
jgi:hypothetical protein